MSDNQRKLTAGTGIPVGGNDIDTDRIIPARFMKCVTFDGLEKYAFYDARFDAEGNPKVHPFNDEAYASGSILIVNKNFGCGSSREHAPQALVRFGMRGIIGESFAEIFAGNCTALGVPAVTASQADIEWLQQTVEANPAAMIQIDLEHKTIHCGGREIGASLPEASRLALLEGTWDTTAILLENLEQIQNKAEALPY